MSSQLPPSRFGAGYTYGGPPEAQPQPQPPPPPSAYQSNPYDTTQVAPPAMTYPATGQYSAPAYPSAPAAAGYGPSGGTAVVAAILGFIGVVVHGIWAVYWVRIDNEFFSFLSKYNKAMKELSRELGNLGVTVHPPGPPGWIAPALIAATVVEVLATILLLIGSIQLLRRQSRGRAMIVLACIPVIILNAIEIGLIAKWTAAITKYTTGFDAYLQTYGTDSSVTAAVHKAATKMYLYTGGPLVLAVITLILVLAPATKRYCQQITPSPYTTY